MHCRNPKARINSKLITKMGLKKYCNACRYTLNKECSIN
jgi:hypothetical protein